MGRLKSLTHQNDDQTIANYDYAWDIANRITAMNDAEYGYDKTSQLVSAEYEALPKELYEYDTNGNRKNFETGKNNRLLSDGEFRYTYDDEGNRIAKTSISTGEATAYTWDHRNRLTQVVMPKGTVSYAYDYQNRMTRRNDEYIVHDGWQIVMALDKNGVVKEKNLWGASQDELIATNDQFTLCDHLGSVRDVINVDGKVLNHIEYNAFGKVVKMTGKPDCMFGYTGKIFDNQTRLQWNINRWYDAEAGRWCSEDPAGFTSNMFSMCDYVQNSPIVKVDPEGLWWNCSTTQPDMSDYLCCTQYQNIYIALGFSSASECATNLNLNAWWEQRNWVVVIAGISFVSHFAPPHVSLPVNGAIFLMAAGTYIYCHEICASYVCTSKHTDIDCSCICAGCIWDTWLCTCGILNGSFDTDQVLYSRAGTGVRQKRFWRLRS